MYILQVLLYLGLIFGALTAPYDSSKDTEADTVSLTKKSDSGQNPFVKRVLKLSRALRAIVTLDSEAEKEMRSAAAARAALVMQKAPRLGYRKPRDTWFGFEPQISASGSSWFPIATSFTQAKEGESSVLLPISPIREQLSTPSSKGVFRSAEMPNPDATAWVGVPEESLENRRMESPSASGRWIDFHDVRGADMTFGDSGMERSNGARLNVFQKSDLTKYGKLITNPGWFKKDMKEFSVKNKWPKDHSKAQPQSNVNNEVDLGDPFFHKNVLLAPNSYQLF